MSNCKLECMPILVFTVDQTSLNMFLTVCSQKSSTSSVKSNTSCSWIEPILVSIPDTLNVSVFAAVCLKTSVQTKNLWICIRYSLLSLTMLHCSTLFALTAVSLNFVVFVLKHLTVDNVCVIHGAQHRLSHADRFPVLH